MNYPDLLSFYTWALKTLGDPFLPNEWGVSPVNNFYIKCRGKYLDKNVKEKNIVIRITLLYNHLGEHARVQFPSNHRHHVEDRHRIEEKVASLPNPWEMLFKQINNRRI